MKPTATHAARAEGFPDLAEGTAHRHIPPKHFPPRKNQGTTEPELPPALMLLMLGEEPIPFKPCFVSIGGSVTAALLLSVIVIKEQRENELRQQGRTRLAGGKLGSIDNSEIWFAVSEKKWLEETCMTHTEFQTAKRLLLQRNILLERLKGMPAIKEYHLNNEIFLQAMENLAAKKYAHVNFN